MNATRPNRTEAPWLFSRPTRSMTTTLAATIVTLAMLAGPSFPAKAQQAPAPSSTETRKLAHLLIKNALISVNQGNLTGNYTVLRDLASPGFRGRNSASDLGTIFANLRQQKIDLSPIVLLDPVITQSKFDKEQNQLRLAGYFPSQPVQIKFDLVFQMANPGGWMIHGVSIGTESAEAQARTETEETARSTPAAAQEQSSKVRPVNASQTEPESSPPRTRIIPASAPLSIRPKK